MTGDQLAMFKAQVEQQWTDARTTAAWAKWYPQYAIQTGEVTDTLFDIIRLKIRMDVLDIASGTGEPALTLAARLGASGHVIATDLSMPMLEAARTNAARRGLRNVSFQRADAHDLPFLDANFDLVTSRFGVMYFADPGQALSELRRVLKPGGQAAFIAWGPFEQNAFMASALAPIFRRIAPPPMLSSAPTPFRYAEPGSLSRALEAAGFQDISEEVREVNFPWPGPPEELWQHFYEVGAPFHPLIEKLSEAEREQVISEVIANYQAYFDGHQVDTKAVIVAASAIRGTLPT